ncbi:hypothetical protein [Nocardia asteroides]|uniref:hypothetical protein n=1 Tax=Nocardia asteroides TaxID=1824 RepID=UPI001E440A24|nr:hypothetical protein [Nocardia asteroides]UGT60237.1 hypothetical protein LTT61_23980 [Nocardia asteroides]
MIVERWTSVEVKALRTAALRDTQEQFAERLGWGVPTIRKWERVVDGRCVRANRAEDLDTVLSDLTGEQLQRFAAALTQHRPARSMHPGSAATQSVAVIEEDADVRRRDFGKLAALTAAGLPTWDGTSTPRLGAAEIARLTAMTEDLRAAEQRIGGAPLVEHAATALDTALALLRHGTYSEADGSRLMAAIGDLALRAGFLAYDSDRHTLARRCYTDAVSLASTADDSELLAHACLNEALQAIALARKGHGSPSYGLALIRRAADLVRRKPPGRIHALIAAREAGAHGVAGDRASTHRAAAMAWREMDYAVEHEPLDECPPWLAFVTHSEIRSHEAGAHHDLGDLPQAISLYEVACAEPAGPRNRANSLAWLSVARAQLGDHTGAADAGLHVLAALEREVSSIRTLTALRPVRAAVGGEFGERFDMLMTTKVDVYE